MALKKLKPTTPGQRFKVVSTFEEITTNKLYIKWTNKLLYSKIKLWKKLLTKIKCEESNTDEKQNNFKKNANNETKNNFKVLFNNNSFALILIKPLIISPKNKDCSISAILIFDYIFDFKRFKVVKVL